MDISIDFFIKLITFFISIISFYWSQKHDVFNFRRRRLTNFYEFREKFKKLENEPKYLQEIEINIIHFFRKLSWEQVDFLIDKDINFQSLTNIRFLFIYELCILEENTLKIPNKLYVYKKYLTSLKNIIVSFFAFLFVIVFFGLILSQKLSMVQYLLLLGVTLLLEFYLIYLFDGITTYHDLLKDKKCTQEVNLKVSEDFLSELEHYNKKLVNQKK